MILYHGSYVKVKNPEILRNEKGRDFGCAFYLTPVKSQAERMAKRKHKQMIALKLEAKPIVSVFEWDENITKLNYKDFTNPDLEWLEMILKCRTNPFFSHGFDIVKGKIADDSVGETVSLCLNGYITKEEALRRLEFQKINSQIAFCSERSLKGLRFVESYEVK